MTSFPGSRVPEASHHHQVSAKVPEARRGVLVVLDVAVLVLGILRVRDLPEEVFELSLEVGLADDLVTVQDVEA